MMMRSIALAAGILALTACTSANVQVPSEIQSAGKKISFTWSKGISGKDPVNFAPFKADAMDIGWQSSSGSSMSVGGFGKGEKTSEQKYKFTMTRDGSKTAIPVECLKTGSESGMSVGGIGFGGSSKSTLSCKLDEGKLLGDGSEGGFKGSVSQLKGGKDIFFTPIFLDDKGNASKQPLGYQLSVDSKPLAVINLGAERAYWYVPQNDEGADLNLAASAIALFISAQ